MCLSQAARIDVEAAWLQEQIAATEKVLTDQEIVCKANEEAAQNNVQHHRSKVRTEYGVIIGSFSHHWDQGYLG